MRRRWNARLLLHSLAPFAVFFVSLAAIFGSPMLAVGLVVAGFLVAPLLSLPRALLNRYEQRKVRLVTHRIDAGVRELAAGNLSHPAEEDAGNVSLASRS